MRTVEAGADLLRMRGAFFKTKGVVRSVVF